MYALGIDFSQMQFHTGCLTFCIMAGYAGEGPYHFLLPPTAYCVLLLCRTKRHDDNHVARHAQGSQFRPFTKARLQLVEHKTR